MKPNNPKGRPMKFNEKDVEVVKAMWANGLNVQEILIAFDNEITDASIRKYCKGVEVHKERRREYLGGLRDLFKSWAEDKPLEEYLSKPFAELLEGK